MGKKSASKQANSPFAALKGLQLSRPLPAKASGQRAPVGADAAVAGGRGPPGHAAGNKAHPDEVLFAAAVAGAKPLGESALKETIQPRKPPVVRLCDDDLALAELAALCAGTGPFDVHGSEEEFYGSAPGVNRTLLDGLRRGQYAIQATIDLHGMVREQAHAAVARFVAESRTRDGATCVLIVTGRGRSSPMGLSVLREALPRWLSRAPVRPHVLAYATARAIDGGPGAFYVLLRRQGVPPFGSAVLC